jgi:micrococcal nuclease
MAKPFKFRKKDVIFLIAVLTVLFNYFFALPKLKEPADQSIQSTGSVQGTSDEKLHLVSKVIDGDTIQLASGETIRYIGIDTPETVKPNTPVQCFGKEASAKNSELVEGKYVRLDKDVSDKDRYGRLLRYVYVEDIFVNDYLVREGFASAASFPPDIKFQDQFRSAEAEARQQLKGLWSSCPN